MYNLCSRFDCRVGTVTPPRSISNFYIRKKNRKRQETNKNAHTNSILYFIYFSSICQSTELYTIQLSVDTPSQLSIHPPSLPHFIITLKLKKSNEGIAAISFVTI